MLASAAPTSSSELRFERLVDDETLAATVSSIQTISPLNLSTWQTYLATHPDREFAKTLIDYITHGVPLGYTGPRHTHVHNNWPSVQKFAF